MQKILAGLQSRQFRTGFLLVAIIAAVWALAKNWDGVAQAVGRMPWWASVVAIAVSFVYVPLTMLSWRAVLNDAGERVPDKVARRIFYSSQVAKYLPGGVWNFVAAAEIGAEYSITRRRSFFALLVSMAVSVGTGVAFAVLAIALGPQGAMDSYLWMRWVLPVILVCLTPPVLNRVIGLALRVLHREALESSLTWKGTGVAVFWSCLSWLAVGVQLWIMLTQMGMEATVPTFLLATGGYALGWTAGFLVFFVPAGVGVREVALGAVLATVVGAGVVVAVVLLSRVFTTLADVGLGVTASVLMRKDHHRGGEEAATIERAEEEIATQAGFLSERRPPEFE